MLKAPFTLNEKEQEDHKTKRFVFFLPQTWASIFPMFKMASLSSSLWVESLKEGGKKETHRMKDKGPI
jgi:hypothetical protein